MHLIASVSPFLTGIFSMSLADVSKTDQYPPGGTVTLHVLIVWLLLIDIFNLLHLKCKYPFVR